MAKISRTEAREKLFELLFEAEFKNGESPIEIYNLACNDREIPGNEYIKNTFFGVLSKIDIIDEIISRFSKGWRADRLSKVSRTIIRIAVYEILFVDDIHPNISISQAVDLSVKFGEDKAKQFVNGVLSGLFKEYSESGVEVIIADAVSSLEQKKSNEEGSNANVEKSDEQ